MNLTLSVPSKTFLTGEYAVLSGGQALILCTGPRFELRVRRGTGQVGGIPEGSPAAKWLEQREPLLREWDLEFVDPHSGRGGFGASGAQFVLVHHFTTCLQSSFSAAFDGPATQDLWNDHQVLSGRQGSGADVLAQVTGQVSRIDMEQVASKPLAWPYPEVGFAVIRTNRKIATHAHVASLDRVGLKSLLAPAHACAENFGRAPAETFVLQLRTFAYALREAGMQTAMDIVNACEEQSWCFAAKGCGALGADTVLTLFPAEHEPLVRRFVAEREWELAATQNDLSHGLELRFAEGYTHAY